jgi:hypothetical protein
MDVLNALLQPISALLIFAAAYLVLLSFVVLCFVIASCFYKCGSLARAYTVRSLSLDSVIPQIDGRDNRILQQETVRSPRDAALEN